MPRPLRLLALAVCLLVPLSLCLAPLAADPAKGAAAKTLHRYGVRLTQGKAGIPPERLYVPRCGLKVPAVYDQRVTGCWPQCYDQGRWGSCGPNSAAGMLHFRRTLQGLQKLSDDPSAIPSRFYIYRHTRLAQGDVADDTGVDNATMMRVVTSAGFPFEGPAPRGVPYLDSNFNAPAPTQAQGVATHHRGDKYQQVPSTDIAVIKAAIANNDPVLIGFYVYESFESDAVAKTGQMPMPRPGEQLLGGHDVVAIGYDDSRQVLVCRNSWGTGWGLSGHFFMPYAYATDINYASDFYTITVAP